ncbi:MAG: thermonuclease family protein [Synechococcaceae cyanobacterium]
MARALLPHLIVLLGLSAPLVVAAQPPEATVLSIGDGDTLRVRRDGHAITVRLACIDAPEMAQRPHGQRARDYLRMRLPIGSSVRLDEKSTDRYGRTVAEVISEINIGLALVEDGQAFAYRQYLSDCDAREYLDAEFRASRRRHGVWQVPGGITRPWDFRRSPRGRIITDGTKADGHRCRGSEIGSCASAKKQLCQGPTYLDGDGDGAACESLRRRRRSPFIPSQPT